MSLGSISSENSRSLIPCKHSVWTYWTNACHLCVLAKKEDNYWLPFFIKKSSSKFILRALLFKLNVFHQSHTILLLNFVIFENDYCLFLWFAYEMHFCISLRITNPWKVIVDKNKNCHQVSIKIFLTKAWETLKFVPSET